MMKSWMKMVSLLLCACLICPPGTALAAASKPAVEEDAPAVEANPTPAAIPAPKDQVDLLKRLSKLDSLEALKPWAGKKGMTDTDVTDALTAAYPAVQAIDTSLIKAGDENFPSDDFAAFLKLVRDKKGALRARKVSAWTYEKKLEKIVSLTGETAAPAASSAPQKPAPTPGPPPASRDDLEALKAKLEQRLAAAEDKAASLAKDMDRSEKENADLKAALAAERQDRAADRDAQKEELRLVKSLVDNLKGDLAKTNARIEDVGKKADEKTLNDDELRQSLAVMRKDLHDNVQDVSVMKQQVEKLMAPEKTYAKPLDKALTSKWIPGAALLLSVGAIVWVSTKK